MNIINDPTVTGLTLTKESDIAAALAGKFEHRGRTVVVIPTAPRTAWTRQDPTPETVAQIVSIMADSGLFYRLDQGRGIPPKLIKIVYGGRSEWVLNLAPELDRLIHWMSFVSTGENVLETRSFAPSSVISAAMVASIHGSLLKLLRFHDIQALRLGLPISADRPAPVDTVKIANERYMKGTSK
jgi:hypothetical protein